MRRMLLAAVLLVVLFSVGLAGASSSAGSVQARGLIGLGAPGGLVDSGCGVCWWPQPRQSWCSNGSVSDAQAPSPANVEQLALAWSYRPYGGVGQPIVYAAPDMRRPYVYVVADSYAGAGDKRLRALDLATGKLRWKVTAERDVLVTPVADSGMLFDGGGGYLRRYEPRSGQIVWQRKIPEGRGTPFEVVADGSVYMSGGRDVLAFDAQTGRVRWHRSFGGFLDCWPYGCGLAVLAGRVYTAGDFGVRALDAQTGETLWVGRTKERGLSQAVAGDRVFVETTSSIEAFRASDGKHLWHATPGGSPSADATQVVYLAGEVLYALDATSGKLRWQVQIGDSLTRPALANGLVWAGDDTGRLVALDASNGQRLWHSRPFLTKEGAPDGPIEPVVAGEYVLVETTVADGLIAYHVPTR